MRPRTPLLELPRGLAWLGFSLLVLALPAGPTLAHEVVVTPTKSGHYHVNVGGVDHLQHDPVDFGQDLVGTSTVRTVAVTNISRHAVTIIPVPPPEITVSPAQVDLEAAGQSGDSASLTLTYTRAVEGTFNGTVDLAVSHVNVHEPKLEGIDYTAVAVTPPKLELSVPELGLSNISSVDLGYMSNRHYEPYEHPSFELVITNTGGTTAKNIDLHYLELIFAFPSPWGYGDCASNERMNLCVVGEGGLDPDHLGDLAPGESLTTTWTTIPYSAGPYDPVLRFDTDDPNVFAEIEVVVEILPFTLPPEKQYIQSLNEAANHIGTVHDPLGEDPLAELRPKGFDARTVFSVGDFDTVDLRAGNLTVVVPIGGEIPVRGPLSYSLNAVYNSDLWYRMTLDEVGGSEPGEPGGGSIRAVSGEWPDAIYNLVGGWSFHLGRLLPPHDFGGVDVDSLCNPSQILDPLRHERRVHTGQRFVYVDSYGTSHELWAKLHGDEPHSDDPDWSAPVDREYSYTRDGSYLRMWKESETIRWVEEPGGLRRRFQDLGSDHTETLPDRWLLTSIEDHHGNRVDIVYEGLKWKLGDSEAWRSVEVLFKEWPGREKESPDPVYHQPLIVDKVTLPGFESPASREFVFHYQYKTLDRPRRSNFHHLAVTDCLDSQLIVPMLTKIDLADGTHWSFDYAFRALSNSENDDDLRMIEATLPTGGVVEYGYAEQIWDTGNSCTGPGPERLGHRGVERRTVKDGSTVLENTRYLRQIRRTDDIPFGYCALERASTVSSRPYSQQRVAVWHDLGTVPAELHSSWGVDVPKSSLALHHFNIWQYSDRCSADFPDHCSLQGGRWLLDSGRSNIERNLAIDVEQKVGDRYLSTETFSCTGAVSAVPFDDLSTENSNDPEPFAGDRIDNALASCTRVEHTQALFEVSLAGNCGPTTSPNCLRDSRLIKERVVFHDGVAEHFRQTDKSEFDGLGHYRRERTWTSSASTWANDGLSKPTDRVTFRDDNPGVGTLTLNANHRVTGDLNYIPSPWLLETHERFWSREGSIYRGGEACFDPMTGALKATRAWRCSSGGNYTCSGADGGSLSSVRTWQDVVVTRHLNTAGELDTERFFGADGPGVSPTSDLCEVGATAPDGNADYIWDYTYDYGQVKTKKVRGESTFDIHRAIDITTGWPKTETRDSGEVITFAYDAMGRLTEAVSDRAASQELSYTTDAGTQRRRLEAKTYGLGGLTGPLLRTYSADYDGLGRLEEETLPKADGGTVSRAITYDQGGRIRSVVSFEGGATRYSYDYRGRPMVRLSPDGKRQEFLHYGERWSRQFDCLGTAAGASSTGVCGNSSGEVVESGAFRDFFGRTRRMNVKGTGGTRTDFTYDPVDTMLSAKRSPFGTGSPSQTRSWLHDGLGFRIQESIPEQATTTFSGYDTRGNAGLIQIGGRSVGYAWDDLGRLTTVSSNGLVVKSFEYHTEGSGNGKLLEGIRRDHRDGLYTAGGPGLFEVVSTFEYDTAGRPSSRSTYLDFTPDGGSAIRMGHFDQGWGYDALGNPSRISYPTCRTGNHCTDDVFEVDLSYSQGFYLTGVDVVGSTSLGAALGYHPSALVHQVMHQGGGGTDIYGIANGMPRIASIHLASGTSGSLNLGTMTYDSAGNIRSIGAEAYDYDRLGRLSAATVRAQGGFSTHNYTYDVFDNRTNPYPANQSTNRVLAPGAQWDNFGNLVAAGNAPSITTAVYDPLDKLVSINIPATQQDPETRQISIYDHNDLRILRWNKKIDVDPGELEDPVWTLRDGVSVIRELEGTGPQMRTEADFVYAGSRLISSRRYSGTSYGSGTERHYHADQVGHSRLVTGSNGHEVFTEPFGVPLDGIDSGERSVGFQGHETEGALTYMRGRHYYRGLGRFLQVDPGRDPAAWSLYAFAANNPVMMIDPLGMLSIRAAQVADKSESLTIEEIQDGSYRTSAGQSYRYEYRVVIGKPGLIERGIQFLGSFGKPNKIRGRGEKLGDFFIYGPEQSTSTDNIETPYGFDVDALEDKIAEKAGRVSGRAFTVRGADGLSDLQEAVNAGIKAYVNELAEEIGLGKSEARLLQLRLRAAYNVENLAEEARDATGPIFHNY